MKQDYFNQKDKNRRETFLEQNYLKNTVSSSLKNSEFFESNLFGGFIHTHSRLHSDWSSNNFIIFNY